MSYVYKPSLAWPLAVLLPSDELSAEFGTAWFNTFYELVRDTPDGNPTVASRAYAYCGVTFYEALVHGIERGKSLAGQLNGFDELPKPGPSSLSDLAWNFSSARGSDRSGFQ